MTETVAVFKPSPLAAIETLAKILGGLLSPFLVVAAVSYLLGKDVGEFVGDTAAFFALESLYDLGPAIILPLIPMVRLLFTTYTIEGDGVRVARKILERNEQRVEWRKVTALRHRRTLFDRLFDLHRIELVAYGRAGTTLHLVGLRDGAALRDLVAKHMRDTASVEALVAND